MLLMWLKRSKINEWLVSLNHLFYQERKAQAIEKNRYFKEIHGLFDSGRLHNFSLVPLNMEWTNQEIIK